MTQLRQALGWLRKRYNYFQTSSGTDRSFTGPDRQHPVLHRQRNGEDLAPVSLPLHQQPQHQFDHAGILARTAPARVKASTASNRPLTVAVAGQDRLHVAVQRQRSFTAQRQRRPDQRQGVDFQSSAIVPPRRQSPGQTPRRHSPQKTGLEMRGRNGPTENQARIVRQGQRLHGQCQPPAGLGMGRRPHRQTGQVTAA